MLKYKYIKMKTLTNYQKEFILKYFFENEKYAGWKNIGTTLLETGECVVAGTNCIWFGGIGNFIETELAEGFFNCLKYKFNLDYFLSSNWYKEISNEYLSTIIEKQSTNRKEYQELEKEYDELKSII